MVFVEEIPMEVEKKEDDEHRVEDLAPSQERLLDAEAIEEAASRMTRVSARLHLEALAKKLRKESEALQRVEKNRAQAAVSPKHPKPPAAEAATAATKEQETTTSKPQSQPQSVPGAPASSPAAAAAAAVAPASATTTTAAAGSTNSLTYSLVDRFSFDAGDFNSPFVTVYVPLPGVGSISRDLISCDFTDSSFDLIVKDLAGKSYRLFKTQLEKDIDPSKSKIIVKAEKVVVKLAKVKGEYGGYDYWSKLTDAKRKKGAGAAKDDPQKSIMQLMKDMYNDGDDNMKKIIGETMMKQQRGELGNDFDKGMDGVGDM